MKNFLYRSHSWGAVADSGILGSGCVRGILVLGISMTISTSRLCLFGGTGGIKNEMHYLNG